MTSVLCAGLACIDVVFDTETAVAPGAKHRARQTRLIPGGGALNAALAVAGLGAQAGLVAPVGRDDFSDALRAALATAGVGADHLAVVAEAPTSRSAVLVDPDGERTIVNHRDPRLMDAAPPDLTTAAFDVALADTRWPAGAATLARAAAAQGRSLVIDAEAPVLLAEEALRLASHVAFSVQGLADFAGVADPQAGLRIAAERLPNAWLCVTRGAAPVLSLAHGSFAETPAFAVATVDTLGAGDVWHGAFALALGERRPEADALRLANAAAALSTTAAGLSALPDRRALDAFLMETAP